MKSKRKKKKRTGQTGQNSNGAGNPPKDGQQPDSPSEGDLLFQGIANPKKRRFLAAFASCGSISRAAEQANVHWSTHYKWLREADNVAYTEAFNRARDIAGDLAEGEIYRRAFLGFNHPVIYEGEITANYKAYSDNLAMFFLKGLKPERYRENVNLSGAVGLPVDDLYNKIAARQREEKKA